MLCLHCTKPRSSSVRFAQDTRCLVPCSEGKEVCGTHCSMAAEVGECMRSEIPNLQRFSGSYVSICQVFLQSVNSQPGRASEREVFLGGIDIGSPRPVGAAGASIPVDRKGNPITLSQFQEGVGPCRVCFLLCRRPRKARTPCLVF